MFKIFEKTIHDQKDELKTAPFRCEHCNRRHKIENGTKTVSCVGKIKQKGAQKHG